MITFDSKVQKILQDFINLIDIEEYLIYGSCAYAFYTNENITISDIDIIISKDKFNEIIEKLKHSDLYTVFPSEKSIHVNVNSLLGNDGKPFDISLDSFEDYFLPMDIDMKSFEINMNNEIELRYIRKEDLIKIYNEKSSTHPKLDEYKRKANKLLEIRN